MKTEVFVTRRECDRKKFHHLANRRTSKTITSRAPDNFVYVSGVVYYRHPICCCDAFDLRIILLDRPCRCSGRGGCMS